MDKGARHLYPHIIHRRALLVRNGKIADMRITLCAQSLDYDRVRAVFSEYYRVTILWHQKNTQTKAQIKTASKAMSLMG